jgi:DNA ligase (NAD+)
MGTERIRALIDQGYIINFADIYELELKKDALLGLEMSQDQYQKTDEGMLYISLHKALFSLTDGIPLSSIVKFLNENESNTLSEILKSFKDFIRETKKKVAQNIGTIQLLENLLLSYSFSQMEDFLPLPIVLSLLIGKQVGMSRLKEVATQESTVHGIMLELNIDLSQDQEDKIKKLKANTFQEGVINNMLEGIKVSKSQTFERVLFALGIRNIGENTAQILAKSFKNIEALKNANDEELLAVNGVGETLVNSLKEFFADEENLKIIERLKAHSLNFEIEEIERIFESNKLEGMKILASGKLNHFKRDEIIDFIESNGGQYIKSVSKNMDFIIEGEDMGPSKKEKALKLGVKLISEEEFMKMVGKEI